MITKAAPRDLQSRGLTGAFVIPLTKNPTENPKAVVRDYKSQTAPKTKLITHQKIMKKNLLSLLVFLIGMQVTFAQNSPEQQEVIEISKTKWQWMADKEADKLAELFDDKAVFVHMGGSWGKEREVDIIRSGGIWYKNADIHEVSVEIIDNTAILLNRITLIAEVGGNEVTNPFEVTEVYIKKTDGWKLGSLSFTRLMGPADR
jgi:hypothetical protein